MTGKEIRDKFLKFFATRGHQVLPSASLIPANDPSLLWTAAGMVPFKPYFTGAAVPEVRRVTTCQKCLRTPDIDSVGRTARHHTFFEMLGNFSFGDYFKREAIKWAWEFVTGKDYLNLAPERLWITIYQDDDEAFAIWHEEVGVPAERIVRMGKDTNFWEIGVGPCGPCSEIYVDLGLQRGCGSPTCGVGCDCDRFLEIWNLVFIQFFRDEEGNYTPLAQKGIDTGMGLERVASVLQNVATNFDTDLFRPIINFTAELAGVQYGTARETDMALKVIADHIRALTFAIADGAMPSNEGRGYVLRRLLRRAERFGRVLGLTEPFLYRVAEVVINEMGDVYPELVSSRNHICRVIRLEEERFLETLAQGMEILQRFMDEAKAAGRDQISGRDAFRLYDTFGFPLELTREIAAEQGFKVDEAGFAAAMEEQRQRARSARQETEYLSEKGVLYKNLRERLGECRFVGYEQLSTEATIQALLQGEAEIEYAPAGNEVEVILDVTPCYPEGGGQVADRGELTTNGATALIEKVERPVEGLIVHHVRVLNGSIKRGDRVKVGVDAGRRAATARNHSATHLLHKALKKVLGEHVNQAGSLVEPERLRFDFTHYAALTAEELRQVEDTVNEAILAGLPVMIEETTLNEARQKGAIALFDEKYGQKVRVVRMGDFSTELCGGTHVRSTAEIGLFKIVTEGSVGAGLRRIEAVTGAGAVAYVRNLEEQLQEAARLLKSTPADIVIRIEGLLRELREAEKEMEGMRARLLRYEVQSLLEQVRDLDGVKFLAARTTAADMDGLRAMVDLLRDKLGSAVILLGSPAGDRVNLVAAVTKDLVGRGLHAGKLIKEVAAVVGGGGGGRPELAQAGGKDPSRLQEALEKAYAIARAQLN